eukprot:TRINITY_DN33934_c0_g1_i1.p1 TRINITY_DN33934_c0_g1~~TRINITY_DN33934_c0_g1_i1.p1  ORF type:complete len:457 (-),score=94.03 TRINITY_DN33934_c0_g1_i1:122-1342(-)
MPAPVAQHPAQRAKGARSNSPYSQRPASPLPVQSGTTVASSRGRAQKPGFFSRLFGSGTAPPRRSNSVPTKGGASLLPYPVADPRRIQQPSTSGIYKNQTTAATNQQPVQTLQQHLQQQQVPVGAADNYYQQPQPQPHQFDGYPNGYAMGGYQYDGSSAVGGIAASSSALKQHPEEPVHWQQQQQQQEMMMMRQAGIGSQRRSKSADHARAASLIYQQQKMQPKGALVQYSGNHPTHNHTDPSAAWNPTVDANNQYYYGGYGQQQDYSAHDQQQYYDLNSGYYGGFSGAQQFPTSGGWDNMDWYYGSDKISSGGDFFGAAAASGSGYAGTTGYAMPQSQYLSSFSGGAQGFGGSSGYNNRAYTTADSNANYYNLGGMDLGSSNWGYQQEGAWGGSSGWYAQPALAY